MSQANNPTGNIQKNDDDFFLDSGENRFFVPSSVQPKREVVNLEKKPFSFFALGFTVKMKAIGRGMLSMFIFFEESLITSGVASPNSELHQLCVMC